MEKNAGNRKKRGGGVLAMRRILDFIPTKQKACEVIGLGCILETELGKHIAEERETRADTLVLIQTSTHSLDQ